MKHIIITNIYIYSIFLHNTNYGKLDICCKFIILYCNKLILT